MVVVSLDGCHGEAVSHEGSHDGVEARKRNNRMDGQTLGGYLGGHLAHLGCSGSDSKATVASTIAWIHFSLSFPNHRGAREVMICGFSGYCSAELKSEGPSQR
jgi:hypothetical protein